MPWSVFLIMFISNTHLPYLLARNIMFICKDRRREYPLWPITTNTDVFLLLQRQTWRRVSRRTSRLQRAAARLRTATMARRARFTTAAGARRRWSSRRPGGGSTCWQSTPSTSSGSPHEDAAVRGGVVVEVGHAPGLGDWLETGTGKYRDG